MISIGSLVRVTQKAKGAPPIPDRFLNQIGVVVGTQKTRYTYIVEFTIDGITSRDGFREDELEVVFET